MSIDMGNISGGADVRHDRVGDEEGARPFMCNSVLDSVSQKASKERWGCRVSWQGTGQGVTRGIGNRAALTRNFQNRRLLTDSVHAQLSLYTVRTTGQSTTR